MGRMYVTLLFLLASSLPAVAADGFVDRMAREHALDSTAASPAALEEPLSPVTADEVTYASVEGTEIRGFFAAPENSPTGGPALIVIHEWWGLNDNIRSMARRFAGEGYRVLAVDLYEGRSADDRDGAAALMRASTKKGPRLEENIRQAYRYLKEERQASKVGVVGWCFGGGWSLQTALLLPDRIEAAVIYYGRLVTDADSLRPLAAPILGIFGALDRGVPVAEVRKFEEALDSLGKDAVIHVYEGADHAFANPSGNRYQKEAAEDAWSKTVTFFAGHLKE